MFDKDFRITGKHANYWKDLCECSCTVKKQETENKRKTASTTLFRTKEIKDQKTSTVEMCITGYGIMDNSIHSTWKS